MCVHDVTQREFASNQGANFASIHKVGQPIENATIPEQMTGRA